MQRSFLEQLIKQLNKQLHTSKTYTLPDYITDVLGTN